MAKYSNKQLLLSKRPQSVITEETFQHSVEEINENNLVEGDVLVKNTFASLDPAMRGWMNEEFFFNKGKSYIEPVKLGDVMRATTVGVIVASKNPKFQVGKNVVSMGGLQNFTTHKNGRGLTVIADNFTKEQIPLFLSVLGGTGLTAYFGLLDIGKPKKGETVLVSGAAGAVGSVVGQMAKILGCYVVGIAGTDEKCNWLTSELGFDAVINYKTCDSLGRAIHRSCPKGVDIYFDNVGGDMLDEALRKINLNARVVICGAISQYNTGKMPVGPKNYLSLLTNRATMQGFVILDFTARFSEGIQQLWGWIQEGKLKHKEDYQIGLNKAPEAINMLFSGANTGKLILQIDEELKPNL